MSFKQIHVRIAKYEGSAFISSCPRYEGKYQAWMYEGADKTTENLEICKAVQKIR